MKEHVIKVLPGEDLIIALDAYCKKHHIKAAYIATCVGSLSTVMCRKGRTKELFQMTGHFEIVSCVGTLSMQGMHIHMSVSNDDFAVFGGHVRPGSIVLGAAEIVLIELEHFELSRTQSDLKSFKELKIIRIIS